MCKEDSTEMAFFYSIWVWDLYFIDFVHEPGECQKVKKKSKKKWTLGLLDVQLFLLTWPQSTDINIVASR